MRRFLGGSPEAKRSAATILARAWRDGDYRERLIAEPRATFAAADIAVPPGVEIEVTADSERVRHVILGAEPTPVLPLASDADFGEVRRYIDARSHADPEFRAALLADPAGTVRGLGHALPEGVEIAVHVTRPDHAYFNIPLPPRADQHKDGPKPGDDDGPTAALYFSIPLGGLEEALYFPIPIPTTNASETEES